MGSCGLEPDFDEAPWPPKDTVLSLRTGKKKPLAGVNIISAINKQPRVGKVQLRATGFEDDERVFPPHKSPDNAIHHYASQHYASWRQTLPDRAPKFRTGAFGENISTRYLSESNVCVGDTFRLGPEAVVQVSMTRQPCYKLNHRFDHARMSTLVQNTGRTGWYYRVLREGPVQVGDAMEIIDRPNPTWPLARLQHYLYADRDNAAALREIRELRGLSAEFVALCAKRLERGAVEPMDGRLRGAVQVPWEAYKLVEKTRLTPRVARLVFAKIKEDGEEEDGKRTPFPAPFPHVRLKFGDPELVRAYSVVGGDTQRFEIGVARAERSRGGSAYLHDGLREGATVQVAPGHHHHPPPANADTPPRKHVFVAAGIGITAFLPRIRALVSESAHVVVHYALRAPDEAAYLDRLPPHTRVYARRLRVERAVPPLDHQAMVYCSGPPALRAAVRAVTRERGYAPGRVHFEDFLGAEDDDEPFEVQVRSSGQVLRVPAHRSLLDVLREAGLDVEASCRTGSCGTCLVGCAEGARVRHRGVAIDEETQRNGMLACVSRAVGRVVVDL
ncbi:pyruvate kinase-like protein [Camillea tinctor]|nr:pyruvate kinase-like protein [Camillea tinctor]